MRKNLIAWLFNLLFFSVAACGTNQIEEPSNSNPSSVGASGKVDTAYYNPDGLEVEIDLEGDIVAPEALVKAGPAELGQYALTYLRTHGQMYIESLAEAATSARYTEWLINDQWLSSEKASQLPAAELRHFRMRGLNAVLLFEAADALEQGKTFAAKVPLKPFSIMQDQGDKCAQKNDHVSLDQSTYWYVWNPDQPECTAELQQLKVTVSKMLPEMKLVYPEYDRLIADKKLTIVMIFGQLLEGEFSLNDPGMINVGKMAVYLKENGYTEIKPAPLGYRFTKMVQDIQVEFDIYSPEEFAGLSDVAHFANFQKAISEHEIIVYDGHSMLGASDFWSKPTYPDFYQIFLYGGCLGYQYYIRPIIEGKKGWENLDVLSSVTEVSVSAHQFAVPLLAKMIWSLENGYRVSWQELVKIVRENVGNSTCGASGVRDNNFQPEPLPE